jgi:hypothetical protein
MPTEPAEEVVALSEWVRSEDLAQNLLATRHDKVARAPNTWNRFR